MAVLRLVPQCPAWHMAGTVDDVVDGEDLALSRLNSQTIHPEASESRSETDKKVRFKKARIYLQKLLTKMRAIVIYDYCCRITVYPKSNCPIIHCLILI